MWLYPHAVDDEIARLERNKRWHDVVRELDRRAQDTTLVPAVRCQALLRAMRIYVERFANLYEAIAVAERVLALDPEETEAIGFLRSAYRARREHAKLADLEARLRRR